MSEASVTIFFEGRSIPCRAGATVAVALWEHGVRILSHSPKYGRPRGLHCARGACMSCLMRIDGVPNVRSCSAAVHDGMRVERQDSGGFFGAPLQKALNAAGHFLPVGFYYKWFTKPSLLNAFFMKTIRPLTGIGRLPSAQSHPTAVDETRTRDLGRFDTIVVGAGPAGLQAALAREGDILLVDDNALIGGQRRVALEFVASRADRLVECLPQLSDLRRNLEVLARRVSERGNTRFMHATVVGAWQPDLLLLRNADGLSVVRGSHLVWSAGAFDAFPIFDDHDMPGILGPRAIYRLLTRDGLEVKGLRTVVFGHGLDVALSAALLHAAGAVVTLALDGDAKQDGPLLATALQRGWQVLTGLEIRRARGRQGALRALEFAGSHGGRSELPCAIAVIAAGAKPIYDAPYQLGVDLVLDPTRGGYVPAKAPPHAGDARVTVTGEASGLRLEAMLKETAS